MSTQGKGPTQRTGISKERRQEWGGMWKGKELSVSNLWSIDKAESLETSR